MPLKLDVQCVSFSFFLSNRMINIQQTIDLFHIVNYQPMSVWNILPIIYQLMLHRSMPLTWKHRAVYIVKRIVLVDSQLRPNLIVDWMRAVVYDDSRDHLWVNWIVAISIWMRKMNFHLPLTESPKAISKWNLLLIKSNSFPKMVVTASRSILQ